MSSAGSGKVAIYVALGVPYYIMAMNSIKSLKDHNPELSVVVVTDCFSSVPNLSFLNERDKFIFVDKNVDARTIKTSIMSYVGSEHNVYIDCDTEILGSLDAGFSLLDAFDLAMRPHAAPLSTSKGNFPVLGGRFKAKDMPHWNSGVIFFRRNERVSDFFDAWKKFYLSCKSGFDQVSLVDAVFNSDIKICPLDLRWNGNTAHVNKNPATSVILHYTSDMDKRIVDGLMSTCRELEASLSLSLSDEFSAFLERRRLSRLQRGKYLSDMSFMSKALFVLKKRFLVK